MKAPHYKQKKATQKSIAGLHSLRRSTFAARRRILSALLKAEPHCRCLTETFTTENTSVLQRQKSSFQLFLSQEADVWTRGANQERLQGIFLPQLKRCVPLYKLMVTLFQHLQVSGRSWMIHIFITCSRKLPQVILLRN